MCHAHFNKQPFRFATKSSFNSENVTGPVKINHVSKKYTLLWFYEYLLFWNTYALPMNFRRFSIKFYINGINFVWFIQTNISYDRVKLIWKKYALTWLIFAGQIIISQECVEQLEWISPLIINPLKTELILILHFLYISNHTLISNPSLHHWLQR